MGLHLRRGPQRIPQKSREFPIGAAVEPFSNVSHDGYGGTLYLVPQSEICREGSLPCNPIDLMGKISGFSPRFYVFKPLDARHACVLSVPCSEFEVRGAKC